MKLSNTADNTRSRQPGNTTPKTYLISDGQDRRHPVFLLDQLRNSLPMDFYVTEEPNKCSVAPYGEQMSTPAFRCPQHGAKLRTRGTPQHSAGVIERRRVCMEDCGYAVKTREVLVEEGRFFPVLRNALKRLANGG